MWEIITKPNHVLCFWKVKSRLCLERERMYALCAGGSGGYRPPIEKELVIFWWVPFRFFHSCDLHLMERQIGNAGNNF
jgi:hypothetical protein